MTLARALIETVRSGLRAAGIDIHRVQLNGPPGIAQIAEALSALRDGDSPEREFLRFCAARIQRSHSQLLQDLFVLRTTCEKRNGYFVEFGGTDGVSLSNTYMLERDYAWNGIVAEPALCWHEQLRNNRQCHVATQCVWSKSGERLSFIETPMAELSTIARYSEGDVHAAERAQGRRYDVETISLNDLLEAHSAPRDIDYLSVDTEGSELQILSAFDFSRHSFRCITVEHNFTRARPEMAKLLAEHGYRRVFEQVSFWDDWYVRED